LKKILKLIIQEAPDLRDISVFGGILFMGYGLYLFQPWVAFTAIGACFVAIGLFFGRIKEK
jgi:hypothetical protein